MEKLKKEYTKKAWVRTQKNNVKLYSIYHTDIDGYVTLVGYEARKKIEGKMWKEDVSIEEFEASMEMNTIEIDIVPMTFLELCKALKEIEVI